MRKNLTRVLAAILVCCVMLFNVEGRPHIIISGNAEKYNLEGLSKYGAVKEVTYDEVFRY